MNTENNKKIAEFMGHRYDDNRNSHSSSDSYYEDSELEYNSSWDWLMEVVERINIIDDYSYTVIIKSMDVQIYNNISGKNIFESECKWQPDELIKSLYEAVIAFIDWYNKTQIN